MITLVIGLKPARRAKSPAERERTLEDTVPDEELGSPLVNVPGEAHAESDVKRTTTTKFFIRNPADLTMPIAPGSLFGRISATSSAGTIDLN